MAASIGCSLFPGGFRFQNRYTRFRGVPSGFFKVCTQNRLSVDAGLEGLVWRDSAGSFPLLSNVSFLSPYGTKRQGPLR